MPTTATLTKNDLEQQAVIFIDYRPDLKVGNEELGAWHRLIELAHITGNQDLGIVLLGFRSVGMRLIEKQHGWVLRPVIGDNGWEDNLDYEKYRSKYLAPTTVLITHLLKELKNSL